MDPYIPQGKLIQVFKNENNNSGIYKNKARVLKDKNWKILILHEHLFKYVLLPELKTFLRGSSENRT